MRPELWVVLGVNVAMFAVAWGDMRRQVAANRERQDERHAENQCVLREIRDDVKRINGTVSRHGAVLADHAGEIDRLRNQRRP